MRRALFGPKSVWTARAMDKLASVLSAEWKLDEAEALYSSALSIYRAELGEQNLAAAKLMGHLAEVRQLQGKTAEAERMYRDILAMQRKHGGDESPWTLTQLAKLLHAHGRLQEAEPLYRVALAKDTELLSRDDPLLARRMIVLAEVLHAQKKLPEAEELYQRAITFQRSVLGDADRNVQSTVAAFTRLLQEAGKLAQAEAMYRELVSSQRKLLGESHPMVAETMDNLALSLRAAGKNAEADEINDRAANMRATSRLASTSPIDIAEARLINADILIQSRSYAEAEALLLQLRLHAPGRTRAKARDKLIEIYRASGQPEKASELLGQRVQSAKLTPASGRVVKYQLEYAQSLVELARFEDAQSVLKEAYGACADSEKRLVAQQLTTLYLAWNKPEQALEWESKVAARSATTVPEKRVLPPVRASPP